jgi:polyisoprenoid-binding protein YceI
MRGGISPWSSDLRFFFCLVFLLALVVLIQAASVDTGSGMKNGKLKSKDFFDVENNPLIAFHSTKVEQIGPDTVVFDGDFTIRGVAKREKLTFAIIGKGTGWHG